MFTCEENKIKSVDASNSVALQYSRRERTSYYYVACLPYPWPVSFKHRTGH